MYSFIGKSGNNLLIRECENETGTRRISKEKNINYQLFEPTKTETKYQTHDGKRFLEKIGFDSINQMKNYLLDFDDIVNFQIYGQKNPILQYIANNYNLKNYVVDLSKIFIATFDIETGRHPEKGWAPASDPFNEITAITIHDNRTDYYYVWGLKDEFKVPENYKYKVVYKYCESEKHLLLDIMEWFERRQPDALTGWNITTFDIPYLVNRIKLVFEKGYEMIKSLSPFRQIYKRMIKNSWGGEEESYVIVGISNLDYITLYKKFTYGAKDSYKLDNIAFIEVKEKKIDYTEIGTLFDLYNNDYQTYIEYNIHDVGLVNKIDNKLQLLKLTISLAYKAGCNFDEAVSPVRMWEALIYNELRKQNKYFSCTKKKGQHYRYIGAYVKDVEPCRKKWVLSVDLASLYPHIQMEMNISPEKFIETSDLHEDLLFIKNHVLSVDVEDNIKSLLACNENLSILKKHNVSMTPNGQFYKKGETGFIPVILKKLYAERKVVKTRMIDLKKLKEKEHTKKYDMKISSLDTEQKGIKVLINAEYGAFANKYFYWGDTRNAEAITSFGQLAIQWVMKYINPYINKIAETEGIDYCYYSDTDSVYIELDAFVQKYLPDADDKKILQFLIKFGEGKLQDVIEHSYGELADYMNANEQAMKMKMEVISNNVVQVAKKRYIMNKLYDEGVIYDKPKMKVMGVEAVKSSTPSICRTALTDAMKIILNGKEEEAQEFIADFKEKFKKASLDEISFPRSVNGMEKYYNPSTIYSKGTPIAVRGSLIFNYFREKHNIVDTEKIQSRDKIKFFYMKEPNVYRSNILSYVTVIPKEFPDVKQYIDYNIQFEKSFLKPLEQLLTAVGWKSETTNDLSSFFS